MEELNQVQETNEEGLFDDFTEETVEEPTASEESNEVAPEEPNSSFLNVKFNGEEMGLSEDEARTLAQKGMNYDRFYEPIERLARLNGLSVGEYLNRLNDTQVQYEVSKTIEELKQNPKYEGVSDEVLEEIANSRVQEQIGQQDHQFQQEQQGIADAEQARVKREVDMFLREYPEFKNQGPEALDPKVYDYVKQGYTLLEAYNKFSKEQANSAEAQAKQKTSKLNEENKKKSLGNTTSAGNVESDDFLSGFLNG